MRSLLLLVVLLVACTGAPAPSSQPLTPAPTRTFWPIVTPLPTLPPVTDEQLKAFSKYGTIPAGYSALSRDYLDLLAIHARGAAQDACVAKAITPADRDVAEAAYRAGHHEIGAVTYAVLFDRRVACWRSIRAAWDP